MASLTDLYTYYCRRCDCRPNSRVCAYLDAAYEAHGKTRLLETVDLSDNYVGPKGLIPVLDLVKNSKTVVTLDISHHTLEQEQLQHLVYCLMLHPCITRLAMRDCGVDESGAPLLQQLLDTNHVITELDLTDNNLLPTTLAHLQRRCECNRQICAHNARAAAEEEQIRRSNANVQCEAVVTEELGKGCSGGHLHFATWWRNPQYKISLSHTSRVQIVMEVNDGDDGGARQVGFVVLRHDGVRRVVHRDSASVVGESAIDSRRCVMELRLRADEHYVIMPFTFRPGRDLCFVLRASLLERCDELCDVLRVGTTAPQRTWLTLERLDARYDWCVHEIRGEWATTAAVGEWGWMFNNMYRVELGAAALHSTAVRVHALLYKHVDPDVQDERCVGLDVVHTDPRSPARPPLSCTADVRHAASPRDGGNEAFVSFTLNAQAATGLYVVPSSTQLPDQGGSYTLVLFSSEPLLVSVSRFPHGWHYRVVDGAWSEAQCGGLRGAYASWKNNPSIALTLQGDDAATARGVADGAPTAVPFTACLELCPEPARSVNHAHSDNGDGGKEPQRNSAIAATEATHALDVAATDAACGPVGELDALSAEAAAFVARHRAAAVEACVALVADNPPWFTAQATTPTTTTAVHLNHHLARTPPALVVAMTRHAGQLGRFRAHLFCAEPFVVDAESATLAYREQQAALLDYAQEAQARCAEDAVLVTAEGDHASETDTGAAHTPYEAVRAACVRDGRRFHDRDFPCGASSVWLDPAAKPPPDFPRAVTWRRASALGTVRIPPPSPHPTATDSRGDRERAAAQWPAPPFPYGRYSWFASVVHALAAKPRWLARLFVAYEPDYGVAQFRFYSELRWVDVVVDDHLLIDAAGALCMGSGSDPQDMFYPLLEKAYAKLHRCYAALDRAVVPQSTLLESFVQGLMDVSGGLCVVHSFAHDTAARLSDEQREQLWRTLKTASNANVLIALVACEEEGSGASRHAGILANHLYGVVDVRFVEQQRLVRLRNWRDGAQSRWEGKWGPRSARWTPLLRQLLRYGNAELEASMEPSAHTAASSNEADTAAKEKKAGEDEDEDAMWLSYDEVVHYFSHMLVTERYAEVASVAGDFPATLVDPAETDARLRNPQFALEVVRSAAQTGPVELILGLHQRDARRVLTRAANATVRYPHKLGLAVFCTADNRRRLTHVADEEVVQLLQPRGAREMFCTVTLDLGAKSGRTRLTLMPFKAHERDAGTGYTLTARCACATVALRPIADNALYSVAGTWPAHLGPTTPSSRRWRDNAQFFLAVGEGCEVSLTLHCANVAAQNAGVGFTVHTTRSCSSFLHFDPDTVVLHVPAERGAASVSGTVRLGGAAERRGMPYVVVPYYDGEDRGEAVEFVVQAVANRKVQLSAIEPRLDWHRQRCRVHLSAEAGNVGGGPSYPSWRCSPQYILRFPVAREGRLLLVARAADTASARHAIGMTLLRPEMRYEAGQRRRLCFAEDDVVARTADAAGEVELDVVLPTSAPTMAGGALSALHARDLYRASTVSAAAEPLVLLVYTTEPYLDAELELTVYCMNEVELVAAKEWRSVLIQEGSWELGRTSGGARARNASWINNPFYGLVTLRPTNVVIVLIQYPRGPEKPVVRRYGTRKAFLPPPLINGQRCTAIQLDLVRYDTDLSALTSAGPFTSAEVSLTSQLDACDEHPFLIVPCTEEAERDADFKLIVYADQPVDFYLVEKERMHYV